MSVKLRALQLENGITQEQFREDPEEKVKVFTTLAETKFSEETALNSDDPGCFPTSPHLF